MIRNAAIVALTLLLVNCCKKTTPTDCEPASNPITGCENTLTTTEMNGVSMVAISSAIDSSAFIPVTKINATWVSIIPFGFIPSNSSTVQYNQSWQWYGEKRQGLIETIILAKEQGLKVFLKPHLWIHNIWVGDLEFTNETDWQNFETSYATYILDYAHLADSMGVEAYCVGVELKKTVHRTAFWNSLIDSVKTFYSGKLNYAANWDNYDKVTFWNKLDYIGIDSYFPLSESKTPTFDECYAGWESDFNKIKALSLNENKKVIFTEYGFRNVDYTGKEPWEDNSNSTFNSQGQVNAYQATFSRFWGESWFDGGFLWKWYPDHPNAGGETNNRFTPQNKPVESIIKETFAATND